MLSFVMNSVASGTKRGTFLPAQAAASASTDFWISPYGVSVRVLVIQPALTAWKAHLSPPLS